MVVSSCTSEVWKVSFCAMEMKLKKSWSPLANMISAFGGSLECSAQGNLKYFTCAACSTNLSRKYNFGSRNVIGNNINLPLHKKDYKSTV